MKLLISSLLIALASLTAHAQTRLFTEFLTPAPVTINASKDISPEKSMAAVCTPDIKISGDADSIYQLRNQFNGQLELFVSKAALAVCRVLYREPKDAPNIQRIEIVARPESTFLAVTERHPEAKFGLIYISVGKSIGEMSARGIDTSENLIGIFIHELTHVYQQHDLDGQSIQGQTQGLTQGLREGIADYVRASLGYLPPGSAKQASAKWDAGYMQTAYFLLWIESRRSGFMFDLNKSLSNNDGKRWTIDEFNRLTGMSVNDLWSLYQRSITP